MDDTPAGGAVFITALMRGPVSRADIARLTGLSSAAVTRAAKPLLDAGYLEDVREGKAPAEATGGVIRMGRPGSPLRVRAQRATSVGIKVTGRELIGVLTDLCARPLASRRRSLPTNDVTTTVGAITALHHELVSSTPSGLPPRPDTFGISLSGDIDHDGGLVRYSPFLEWRDVDLGALMAAAGLPVVLENDVKALTVAEQWFGPGREARTFAVVTIGTGIGCALVVDGELVRGAHSVAGEIGHLPLGDRAVRCHCGGHGCVEAVASTTAILQRCRAAANDPGLSGEKAVELARSGHAGVREVFSEAGRTIGLALAAIANLIGPERIVVAGEGVSSFDLIEQAIRLTFARQAFGAAGRCPIYVQDLPFEEWARGASAVAIQHLIFPAIRRPELTAVSGGSHE